MDERIWTIAEILDKSGPMTADELAAQLKLSGKTVRSLIKTYAKEMLHENVLTESTCISL